MTFTDPSGRQRKQHMPLGARGQLHGAACTRGHTMRPEHPKCRGLTAEINNKRNVKNPKHLEMDDTGSQTGHEQRRTRRIPM